MSAGPLGSTDSDPFVLVRPSDDPAGSPSMVIEDVASSMVDETLVWFRTDGPDSVSSSPSWPHHVVARIHQQRKRLSSNRLFFDELLALAEVDAALYPPASSEDLSQLLAAIYASTTFDSLKQASLVFYLLKDVDAFSTDSGMQLEGIDQPTLPRASAKADAFAASSFILPHFKDLMHGYWLMDRDDYENAVPYLTSPDFIPKIYRTLFKLDAEQRRTPLQRSRLLLQFLRTSIQPSPSAATDSSAHLDELEMQVEATCWVRGPTKAVSLAREISSSIEAEEERRSTSHRLMSTIFRHCFAPPNAVAIKNLLACFLEVEEETALEAFILSPPASMSATWSYIAADVLIVRFVNEGRYMDAVRLDRRLGPDVSQGHSSNTDHAERSRLMEKRKRMIAGAREILPEVQKELLRIEESMEISAGPADVGSDGQRGRAADSIQQGLEIKPTGDLRMSWEHVPRPESSQMSNAASPIGSASKLTPLSASPALRHSGNRRPNTQAALLSAVVRASASPKAHGERENSDLSSTSVSSTSQPTATMNRSPMVGFLAKNALGFSQASPSRGVAERATDMDEDMIEGDTKPMPLEHVSHSHSSLGQPGYRLPKGAIPSAAGPEEGIEGRPSAQATSPWRNAPVLTSTSPFAGQPKIPVNAFGGRFDTFRSVPSSASASPFRPANTSPFVAAASSSSRHSPLTSSFRSGSPSVHGGQRLTGALALISKQGRRRPDAVPVNVMYDDEDGVDEDDDDEMMDGDDTFVERSAGRLRRGHANGKVQVGRLVHGKANATRHEDAEEDSEMEADEDEGAVQKSANTAAMRSARSTSARGKSSSVSRSRSEATLSKPNGRQTRSATAVNRKPLTLSNLAANDEQQGSSAILDAGPIARRTRAATAELESQQGEDQLSQASTFNRDNPDHFPEDGGSTIYSISEHGDGAEGVDALPNLPSASTRRSGRRSTTTSKGKSVAKKQGSTSTRGGVRRSSRLSSVEPEAAGQPSEDQENEPPRRRKAVAVPTRSVATRNTSKAGAGAADTAEEGGEGSTGVRTRSGRRTMPGALGDD